MIKLMAVVAVCTSLLAGTVFGVDTDLRLGLLKACGESCLKAAATVEAAMGGLATRLRVKLGSQSGSDNKPWLGGESGKPSRKNQAGNDLHAKPETVPCEDEGSGLGIGAGLNVDLEVGSGFDQGPQIIDSEVGVEIDGGVDADIDLGVDIGGTGTGGLGCLLSCP